MANNAGLKSFLKERDELKPNPVAEVAAVEIALVDPKRKLTSLEKRFDFAALHGQERPDDESIDARRDPGQATRTTPPEEPQEKGLSLVGHGVARGDFGGANFCSGLPKESIAPLPAHVFDVEPVLTSIGPNVLSPQIEREGVLLSHLDGKLFIGRRTSPQPVVEVGQGQAKGIKLAQLQKSGKESGRIRPPRIGDENFVPSVEELVLFDALFNFLKKEARSPA